MKMKEKILKSVGGVCMKNDLFIFGYFSFVLDYPESVSIIT